MSVQIAELQTQMTKQVASDDKDDLFISGSKEEDEKQSNKNNQALIPYVQQNVSFAKSASKGNTKLHQKK